MRHKVGRRLFYEVEYEAERRGLMSDEHFNVDGTLIEAAAGMKRPEDAMATMGRRAMVTVEAGAETFGEKLSDATHRSVTGPDARLMR